MSAYDNVVGGKLKLKGKALDVKAGGMKKKKKQKKQLEQISRAIESRNVEEQSTEANNDEGPEASDKPTGDESSANWDDNLTPAERRYMEQREKINSHKLAKTSNKSHRDRILDFNQYLANMSEHYDIPKVGPG